ncbi:MAG TPA: quinone oxidoreductase [Thermodesulfobacteriota bacterium]|nr:quinone oxidoreductase [Thermodesulfobacteriota bacterium]
MKAVRVHRHGGPEVLTYEEVARPAPGRGEALVRLAAAGVNYIDIYHRTGLYPQPLPFIPGSEGAGVVEAVGEGVTEVRPGDRVGYAMQLGSYAEYAVVPAWKLVPLPAGTDPQQAAAALLQGMTAHYLTHSTYPLKPGETALVHAAAGGVGLLLVQMAKRRGARVIGTVSTEEKARLAREAGADEVILYTRQDFAAETRRLTGGAGVDVVYDSVGRDTFEKDLTVVRPRGLIVLFGQSSGPVPPFDLGRLNAAGSLFVTRPTLAHYAANRQELLWRAGDVLGWIASGALKLRIERTYPLADAGRAHEDLAGRRTSGKLLLLP